MLTPGRKPEAFENTKRVVNKVKDVFDGKTESEKRAVERKKLEKKVQKLRAKRMKKSTEDRAGLTRQIKLEEAKIRNLRKTGFEKTQKADDVDFDFANEEQKPRFVPQEGEHLGSFRNNEAGQIFKDGELFEADAKRYSRMDGGADGLVIDRNPLDGLVNKEVKYASREDGAIVGRGRGMSDAPVAVLRTAGKNPEYHYSIRYKDTDQLVFKNLEDLLDYHAQKTGYDRSLLKLKFSPS